MPPMGLMPAPPPLCSSVRAFFWRDLRHSAAGSSRLTRVPPSPYPGIIWLTRGASELRECGGRELQAPLPAISLSGAHRSDFLSESSAEGDSFCLAFQPGALALLAGLDMSAFTDRVVPAHDALPASWSNWLLAVHVAPDHAHRIALCQAFLTPRWLALEQEHAAWLNAMACGWGRDARAELAQVLGWSPRHLQRMTRLRTGLRPGEVERMLRAEKALLQMRDADASALDAALAQGYTDQSHFTREARTLYAHPPQALKQHTRQPAGDADWLLRR